MSGAAIVRWLAQVICWVFYRVDQSGTVPADGPLLLLPNHPNALLDPALVLATADRPVRFLAKSTLFDGAFAPVLKAARAIPVYRRADEGVDPSRNSETFAAVADALAQGSAICIFPEGVSHSEGRLVPLRTGAARMALAAEQRGVAVRLIAVGLNFDRKTAFRSRAIVLYGRPFTVREIAAGDEQHRVRLATEAIAAEMRRLVVEAGAEDDTAMVARVDRLYSAARGPAASPGERIARRQAIATGIERLRQRNPARLDEVLWRLRRYDQRLQRFGLRDRHLDWDVSTRAALSFALREGVVALLLLIPAAAGLLLFWVPYQLTGILARLATRQRDVAATATVFVGAGVYAAWLLLITGLAWRAGGPVTALIAAVAVPIAAIAGLFAIERETAVIDTIRSWWVLRRAKTQTRARLRETRSELADLLDEIYEWLSADTRAPEDARMPN